MFVRQSFASFSSFGQLLRYADKRIVIIMKVYIERNNLQVELIRYCKNVDFIHVYFCEATESVQYRPQYRPPITARQTKIYNNYYSIESGPTLLASQV